MPGPWEKYAQQPATAGPQVVGIPRPAKPEKPRKQVVGDQMVDLETGTAAPIPGLKPDQWRELTAKDGRLYLPDRPGLINTKTGDIKYGPGPEKGAENPALKQQQQAQSLLTAAGVDLAKGIDPVADLIKDSTSGRVQHVGANAYGAVTGDATSGMENIGKLQTIVSDMTLQLTGGSLGNQISNSDRDFIMQRVGNLADPDVPANQRLAAWEQVKQRMGNQLGVQPGTQDDSVPPPAVTPSAGETKSTIDPKKQALGGKIAGLVGKGADRNTIMGFAVRNDPTLRNDPKFRAWVDKAIQFRKQHPGSKFSVDPSFYTSEVPLSDEGIAGTGAFSEQARNTAAQSGGGVALANAADAISAGNLDKIAGLVGGDPNQVNQSLAAGQALHGNFATGGQVGGGVLAAMLGEAALARAGMAPGLGRGLLADSTYGAASGGSNSDSDNFLGKVADAGKGFLTAGAGSLAGQGLLKVPGKAFSGVSNPTASYVAREIPGALTVGQMVSQSGRGGAFIKNIEDKLAGSGLDGGLINARRLEGLQKMNSKAFDRALEPIGDNVAGSYGEEAVATAQQKVSAAFQRALGGKVAVVDQGFLADATRAKAAIGKLPQSVADEVNSGVDGAINNYFDPATGALTGENLQPLLRELQDLKGSYYSNNHPLKNRIGRAIDEVSDSVEGLFRRQSPDVMPQFKAAKLANKRLSTLESAVLSGKNTGGVFTSAQLGTADKGNTIKFGGKKKAAAGGGEFHDFQRGMQEVLPNKVPDSGTAGRLIAPAALIGVGAGADYATGSSGVPLGLAGLLALAYTRHGQGVGRLLTRPGGATAKKVGTGLSRAGRVTGAIAGTQAALGPSGD